MTTYVHNRLLDIDILSRDDFDPLATDLSTEVQEYLDAPGSMKILRGGEFPISVGLTFSGSNSIIITDGATLRCETEDMTALSVTGSGNEIRVSVDGRNLAAIGVDVSAGGCEVTNCHIRNLHGTNIGAAGVRADTHQGVHVHSNLIYDISADGNGTIGDNVGSSRAILLTSDTAAGTGSLIDSNFIYNIQGEEGDAIQVIFNSGGAPFLIGDTTVSNNLIMNSNRRSIKIQASNTLVHNNRVINKFTLASAPNLASQIDVIGSNGCTVRDNEVFTQEAIGIQIAGATINANNNIVKGNVVRRNTTNDPAIFFDDSYGGAVSENFVFGGDRGIAIGTTSGVSISRNEIGGGDGTNAGISTVSSSSGLIIEDNHVVNGSRTAVVSLNASDSVVRKNHSVIGTCITSTSSSTGCLVADNTNYSSDNTLTGDFTGNIVSNNFNLGSGNTGAGTARGAVVWSNSIPSTQYPSTTFTRGDVAFIASPTAGGKAGWVCISSGTPGTWKAFGPIDA